MHPSTAVILVNIGTPDSSSVKDVRRYLREFLGDKRVITLPWLFRKLLVNTIIAPFRGPKSAKLYEAIWTNEGSPLLVNSFKLSKALQDEFGSDYRVFAAMRYGNPKLEDVIREIALNGFKQVIMVPLYPQYADSTTGTSVEKFNELLLKYEVRTDNTRIGPFFEHPGFIDAFTKKILDCNPVSFDHVIFSFHGLPVSQTEKMHPGLTCEQANCIEDYTTLNALCYRASCYETARLLARASNLDKKEFSVTFQSRLGNNWIKPYTDKKIKEKASLGLKSLLVVSPAFVADCLETIHELGVEYKNLFLESGGDRFALVESLNDDPSWVKGIASIILDGNKGSDIRHAGKSRD